jgi:hypothetical protein
MTSIRRGFVILSICCLICSCTSAGATKTGIVRFNEVFSEARNEILLLNILRAGDAAPQQFSTVTNVNGAMRSQVSLSAELANISDSIRDVFKPSGTFAFRNPTITIAPLETKEFRQGMMKPVTAEFVDKLLGAGWDRRVVLNLVVGGVTCGAVTHFNSGADDDVVRDFEKFATTSEWDIRDDKPMRIASPVLALADAEALLKLTGAESLSFEAVPESRRGRTQITAIVVRKDVLRSVAVPAEQAAKILRNGAGAGLTVSLARSTDSDPPGTMRLAIREAAPDEVMIRLPPDDVHKIMENREEGLTFQRSPDKVAGRPGWVRLDIMKKGTKAIIGLAPIDGCPSKLTPDMLSFRSPEAMIQYLGAISRNELKRQSESAYFTVYRAPANRVSSELVRTRYRDFVYAVPREDKSGETLALLADIIGFQTTDATLNASKPTVTVPTD